VLKLKGCTFKAFSLRSKKLVIWFIMPSSLLSHFDKNVAKVLCPFSKHINLLSTRQTLQLVSMMPLLHYQEFMALMGWINLDLAIQNLKHNSFV
jgi:hypothetical protein